MGKNDGRAMHINGVTNAVLGARLAHNDSDCLQIQASHEAIKKKDFWACSPEIFRVD